MTCPRSQKNWDWAPSLQIPSIISPVSSTILITSMLWFFLFVFVYNYKCLKPSKILHTVWKLLTALISRTWTHGHKKELSFCRNKSQILTTRVPWPCPGFPGLHLGSVPLPFFAPQVFSRLRTLGLHLAPSGGLQGIRGDSAESEEHSKQHWVLFGWKNERMNESINEQVKAKRKGGNKGRGGRPSGFLRMEWS